MFDVYFGIKTIDPAMIKCESGEWFNLQCLEAIKAFSVENGFDIYCMSTSKVRYLLKSGFKTEKEADEYIDCLLAALHAMKRGNL